MKDILICVFGTLAFGFLLISLLYLAEMDSTGHVKIPMNCCHKCCCENRG